MSIMIKLSGGSHFYVQVIPLKSTESVAEEVSGRKMGFLLSLEIHISQIAPFKILRNI